jgi:hypothetical protein
LISVNVGLPREVRWRDRTMCCARSKGDVTLDL